MIDLRDNKVKIIVIVVAFIVIYAIHYNVNLKLQISKYYITNEKIPEEFNDFKILQLSDYHGGITGVSNDNLIKKIDKIKPDIIVLTGDMVNSSELYEESIIEILNDLVSRYPIYSISGNHEQIGEILNKYEYRLYLDKLNKLGVKVLNNKKAEIQKGGSKINLYGIEMPLDEVTALYIDKELASESNLSGSLGESDEKEFNMLLAHNPVFIDAYSEWRADLVLAGHMHGGIIRIPLIGGLFSSERAIFPKYDAGKFRVNDTTMIVNRGLGSSSFNLRLFNRPDVSVITLKSNKEW